MKRLLLVDDDPDVLEALELLLQRHFEVAVAVDGARALELLRGEHFDVVLLDVMMPVMDGLAVVQALRDADIRVPVLLGSALPNLKEVGRRLQVPAMTKPYDLNKLLAKLNELAASGDGAPPSAESGSDGGAAPGSDRAEKRGPGSRKGRLRTPADRVVPVLSL